MCSLNHISSHPQLQISARCLRILRFNGTTHAAIPASKRWKVVSEKMPGSISPIWFQSSSSYDRSGWLNIASSGTTLTTLTTIYGRFKYRENQEAAEGNSLCLSNLFRLEGLILRFVILSNFIHAKIPPHLHPDPSKRRGIA